MSGEVLPPFVGLVAVDAIESDAHVLVCFMSFKATMFSKSLIADSTNEFKFIHITQLCI